MTISALIYPQLCCAKPVTDQLGPREYSTELLAYLRRAVLVHSADQQVNEFTGLCYPH